MLRVFFDYRGVGHSKYLPEEQTGNKQYYLDVVRCLSENTWKKRSGLWNHRIKPQVCNSFSPTRNVIDQPPYSPDMAPSDFFLFPKKKLPLWVRRFEAIKAIKENLEKELKAVPQLTYKKCMEYWAKRWKICIALSDAYFSGDKIHFDEQIKSYKGLREISYP